VSWSINRPHKTVATCEATATLTSRWPDRNDMLPFPNPAALLRLAGSVLVEAHNEWQVADKRYLSETTLALLNPGDHSEHPVATSPPSRHS
jgi:hypothetical protein